MLSKRPFETSAYERDVERACDLRGWSYDDWLALSDLAKDRAIAWIRSRRKGIDAWAEKLVEQKANDPSSMTLVMLER